MFNPTNIDIDSRGRIWVAEGVNYRETWKEQKALKHPNGDRIMILEDTDGDGKCDSSKVFVEDKDLVCPLGVAVLGNKVVVSCSPNLIVYTDTDGDDKSDKKEIFLTGFGGKDHDHGLHSVIGGLDGKWYFNVGNDGPHEVKDAGGWWLHSGSCYVYGPTGNTGNRKSDDGRIWTGGIALRVDPDGKHLTPLAHNFRNSYEVTRDSFGNLWQSDNDDDGNRGCRTSWLMEGGNMGYFSADGTRAWGADKRPAQETLTAHWHQEDPGVIPLGDNTGAGGPTGVVIYEGGLLPDSFAGSIFDCDAGRNRVWAHKPVADGAGYRFDRSTLIEAKIPTGNTPPENRVNWFRPSDVAVGTDGAIYVSDWYDPGVGGHDMRDKEGGGRILRIAPKGDQTRSPKIDYATLDGQIAALASPAINIRYAAANALATGGDEAAKRLLALVAGKDAQMRARAIWVLPRTGDLGLKAIQKIVREGDESAKIAAFRALRSVEHAELEDAAALASDPSPVVRREVAVAMRDVPLESCRDILIKLAEGYDGKDRFYLEGFGLACDHKEAAIYPILLEKFGDPDAAKWSDAFAGITWRLHPPSATEALAKRAASSAPSESAHKQAVNALAFIPDRAAADAMVQLAAAGPHDVRQLAEWWVWNRAGNDWKNFITAPKNQPDFASLTRRSGDREVVLDNTATLKRREKAALRLASDKDGAMILIALAAEGTFPKDLVDKVTEPIYRNSDLAVRSLATQYFPRRAAGGAPLPPLPELAAMNGDIERGRAVFTGNTASCVKCHAFNGEGRDVGPDLTAIRTKYQRPELLDSILNPSAAIAFGYESWIVQTKDNQVYSGFIIADGEMVALKESTGEVRSIPAVQIKKRTRQSLSVMPDNVGLGLTAQQLADLAEFLLKAPTKAK
jgi:putative membrane-bound dehydrogenase-like protein